MKSIQAFGLIIFFSLNIQLNAQYYLKEGYIETSDMQYGKESYTFKNLTLYPLIAGENFRKEIKSTSDYITLEDALKSKKILITEAEGGDVNRLFIENKSNDTVFIMAGEVVKGGKQDRVIGNDMILVPLSGKLDLEVFCVEHNRWTYQSDRNFGNYSSVSENSVRKKAAVDKNQGAVWEEVEKSTVKQNAETSTGTYTALAKSENLQKELMEYENYFLNSFSKMSNCIGFVGVSGDKIIGCDIFSTPELFQKQMKNLINAYSTESINNGGTPTASSAKVMSYLKEFLTENVNQDSQIKEKGTQVEYKGKKVHINTY